MRQICLFACAGSVVAAGCLVDGSAQAPSDSSSGSATGNGTGATSMQGFGGSGLGKGGANGSNGGGNTGTGGASQNSGGSGGPGGKSGGKGGGNGVDTGAGSGETNPGVGSGFFPASLLPSHAKTAYADWKARYFVSCGAGQARVAASASKRSPKALATACCLRWGTATKPISMRSGLTTRLTPAMA